MRITALARGARLAFGLLAALTLAACAGTNQDQAGAGGRAAPGSQQDFVVNVGDRVFFANDSTDLSSEARSTLDRQAAWLRQYNRYTVTLEGHADERGTREYNLALSARRAAVTRDYLASRGVDGGRIRTVSYGKERPVAVCNEESCWNQNRRAVTVLNAAGS
jgi:peptidoglycan-associated lipoprotein